MVKLFLIASILANVAIVVASCGGTASSSNGNPAPTPTPSADVAWMTEIKALVEANCGGCHNGTVQPAFGSGVAFKASAAKAKITSGEMPLGKTLAPDVKAKLLAYLNS